MQNFYIMHISCHIVCKYTMLQRALLFVEENTQIYRYSYVKLTFEMLTVHGQQHSFSTRKQMFFRKCQSFETENVSTLEGLEPPTFGSMPNALTIWAVRARHLLSHVFGYWLWEYWYFLSKVNIWNVDCARATAFIPDTRTDVLSEVSKLFRQIL